MTTNVPTITFDDSGVTLPEESAILTGVQADINTAFGGGVNSDLSTPQGQLAQSLTAIIGDKNNEIASLANNVDPDKAAGRWQDAIARIYFIDRIAASGTVVTGRCYGLVGTILPAGTAAQDTNGYIYYSTSESTIGAAGYVDVQFQNSTTGPIACPIGNLAKIYAAVTGWDRVENLTAGTLGTDVEKRADFEYRRKQSVAANSVNMVGSIYAAVLDVDDVVDAYVLDNPLSTAQTVGATNYSMVPHSVLVSVAGGESADIAKAIWSNKSGGCDYNGNTSYIVTDKSGYAIPYPSYVVTWLTPTATPVFFNVQIANNASLPADIVTLIRDAIVAAFNGTDGGSRARIGSTIYAGRYYAGVSATDTNTEILSITMGLTSSAGLTAQSFGVDQRPTLDASSITVTLV